MVQINILLPLISLASLTLATPLLRRQAPLDPATTPFYLVTTSSDSPSSNSSLLPDVSATSFYGGEILNDYTIRQQAAGYNSLPTFTLIDGNLESLYYNPFGSAEVVYNSTATATNAALTFAPAAQPAGCLSLVNGYLLATDGETKGWTICPYGEDEEVTVSPGLFCLCVIFLSLTPWWLMIVHSFCGKELLETASLYMYKPRSTHLIR